MFARVILSLYISNVGGFRFYSFLRQRKCVCMACILFHLVIGNRIFICLFFHIAIGFSLIRSSCLFRVVQLNTLFTYYSMESPSHLTSIYSFLTPNGRPIQLNGRSYFLVEKNYLPTHFIHFHYYNTLFIYGSYCRVVIKLWPFVCCCGCYCGCYSLVCYVCWFYGCWFYGCCSLAALYALDLLISSALFDNGISCFDYSISY